MTSLPSQFWETPGPDLNHERQGIDSTLGDLRRSKCSLEQLH